MNNKRDNLAKGTLQLSVASIIFILSGYITNIFLGRYLGPAQYGVYGVLISLMTALNVMQISGIPQAVSKYTAEKIHESNKILASGLFLQLILTLIISLSFFIAAPIIGSVLKDNAFIGYARLTALIFPCFGIFSLYAGYYNGLQNFKLQALMNSIYSIAKLIFVVGLSILFGLNGAIIGFIVAPLTALLLTIGMPYNVSTLFVKLLLRYSVPLIVFSALATLQLSIDLFSLKALSDNSLLTGYYVAAQNIALITYFGMNAIGQVLFPSVSFYLSSNQFNEARKIIANSLRYLLLLLIPIAVLIGATAPGLISLLFGTNYLPAVTPLRILLVGYVFLTIFAMLANVLNGAGRAKISMIIAAFGVGIGFVSCLLLIPKHGANGAAVSTLIGSVVSAIFSLAATYRIFEFNFSFISLLRVIAGSLIILAGGLLIPSSVYLLPFLYILLGALYIVTLHLLGEVTLEDRTHIKNLLPEWLPFTKLL
jgi:O-antigen/teichoic acid export membrane protein